MYECETCGATFYWREDRDEHMDDYDHWPECETCTRTFRTQRACDQHMDATNHWAPVFECETCNREFRSQNAANQHMNALGHWAPKVPCETCSSTFDSQDAADRHMMVQAHYKNYCKSCKQRFQNENNLKMHLNSRIHRGSTVVCPFCKERYTTASGVTHHLERGSCPKASKLNRDTIHRIIRERDPNGVITKKQIEWHNDATTQYSATDYAFDGYSWVCYICHRGFTTRTGLNSHLNSPAHMQKVYHCPNSKCATEFTTLAALFNHLESETCGFMRFNKVQTQVGAMLQGQRLIAF